MEDPFGDFVRTGLGFQGGITCPFWAHLHLRVFVPLFRGSDRPVERQVRIANQLSQIRPCLKNETILALAKSELVQTLAWLQRSGTERFFGTPDPWIPPALGVYSEDDDAFTIQFDRIADGRIKGSALISMAGSSNVSLQAQPDLPTVKMMSTGASVLVGKSRPCTRSTAWTVSQMERRLSVPDDGSGASSKLP